MFIPVTKVKVDAYLHRITINQLLYRITINQLLSRVQTAVAHYPQGLKSVVFVPVSLDDPPSPFLRKFNM